MIDRPLVLGVDIGTTSTKAALFDVRDPARALAVARRASATRSLPGGGSEADPAALWNGVRECIREVAAATDATRISAIGVSGTACGAWLLDEGGDLVRAPILWNDGRPADIIARWAASGFLDRVFAVSGNAIFPGYTLPTLAWLQEREPESLERAATLVFCKDWVRYKLTGVLTSECGDASYAPFDIRRRRWSEELFTEAGLGDHLSLLPGLAAEDEVVPLRAEVAGEVGLDASTLVSVGATDIVAGLIGAGATRAGAGVTILGTSANSTIVADAPTFLPEGVGISAAMPFGSYARTMVNTSGTTTFDWGAKIFTDGDLRRLFDAADSCPDGADRPVLIPYLSPAGTVSPRADPEARGSLVGLRTNQQEAEIARAVVESIGFAVADNYVSLGELPMKVVAVGGGAQSDLVLQTIADVLEVAVDRPAGQEFGARGVALLAAWAAGLLNRDELQSASGAFEVAREFTPRSEGAAEQFGRYRRVRDALWDVWSG